MEHATYSTRDEAIESEVIEVTEARGRFQQGLRH